MDDDPLFSEVLPLTTPSLTPSLTASLSSSIRHHARVIDGRDAAPLGGLRGVPLPAAEEDAVNLDPATEVGFEKEARSSMQQAHFEGVKSTAPQLLDFVANPSGEEGTRSSTSWKTLNESARSQSNDVDTKKFSISRWFSSDEPKEKKSVRFASDVNALVSAISSDKPLDPSKWGRSSFVAPPPTSFRVATRHPSYLGPGYFNQNKSSNKRARRNDQFLRLIIAILCFGISLTFALFFGGGKLGMLMSSATYERKMGKGTLAEQSAEIELWYPEWWREEQSLPDMEARGVKLEDVMQDNVADVVRPRAPGRIETPFLWLIPKSGGNAIRTAVGACLGLVEASDLGAGSDESVLLVRDMGQQKFVNVDMSSQEGLERAKALNLASSSVPDIVISDILQGTLEVFNNRNRARMFAVFRHPLERAVSKYYSDLVSDPNVAGFTLPQYVRSGSHVENNYLTRYMSGHYEGQLTTEHLDQAREFMRRKLVVGLATDLPTSAMLFNIVFGWNQTLADDGRTFLPPDECYNNVFNALSDNSPPAIEEGSEGWKLLMAQNWFDLKVYEYAEYLFHEHLKEHRIVNSLW